MKFFTFILTLLTANILLASSNDQVGRIVKLEGKTEIFTHPSNSATGPSPRVKFENTYYTVTPAKLGMKLENGNMVRTGGDGKIRIIFSNGDQFNIGEGTTYSLNWKNTTAKDKSSTIVNMMYGKFRAVVSKDGPRNNLQVKTKTAALGVRGTDFFVDKSGNVGMAKVSVIRGEVEVKLNQVVKNTNTQKQTEPVRISQGFSAEVPAVKTPEKTEESKTQKAPEIPAAPVGIAVSKTTKQDLVDIQKTTVIKIEESQKESVNTQLTKELETLEKKAVETTLKDIKHSDPELYSKIDKKNIESVDNINAEAVKKVFKEAPKAPSKPGMDDLNDLDENAYDKYFTI